MADAVEKLFLHHASATFIQQKIRTRNIDSKNQRH